MENTIIEVFAYVGMVAIMAILITALWILTGLFLRDLDRIRRKRMIAQWRKATGKFLQA